MAVIAILFYSMIPKEVSDPRPSFYANLIKCELDTREDGLFSFFFNVKIREDRTRLPAQIFFKINKIYNLEQYKITRDYELENVYTSNETISNVSFIIENIYKDYMYLPSQNFNVQLFYCEFTELQKNYMEYNNIDIFDVLDEYCIWIYDYEMFNEKYIHVVSQNPGEQCDVIQRNL